MSDRETLTYVNERGDSIVFSTASQYHVNIKDVSGLSDIRNQIYSINSMGQDGDTYLGNRIESRDIELVGRIVERDKERAQRLRRQLNNILNPQFTAKLIYDFGNFRRVIDCTINNAPVFTRPPILEEFTIQLSCLNPFWREEAELRQDMATWVGGFEFPIDRPYYDLPQGLEIPQDPENPTTPIWQVGWREPSLIVNVFNAGDVRAGMRIDFRALGTLVNPSIINAETGEFIRINITMLPGDVITIRTGFGEKGVTLRRQGVETDAFRFLDIDSTYIQLAVGDNMFRYDADENMESLDITVWHNNFFLGV